MFLKKKKYNQISCAEKLFGAGIHKSIRNYHFYKEKGNGK